MGLYNVSIVPFLLFVAIVIVLMVKFKSRRMVVIMVVLVLSFLYSKYTYNYYERAFIEEEKSYIVKIISLGERAKTQTKYVAQIKSGKYKNYKILLYTKEELTYGDIIEFQEKIELPDGRRNDKGFDYSTYLKEKKISGISKVKTFEKLGSKRDFNYYLFSFKNILNKRLEKTYNQAESSFLKAMLLGEKDGLEDDIKENFKNASISHILAISGMHVAYIVLGIEFLLKKIIKSVRARNIIIIVFLNLFAIFAGGSNSVWRACIMTSTVYLGNVVLRSSDFFASFRFALIVLLVMNPYNIFSPSMWLSFGGSIGIVLYSKLMEKSIVKRFACKQKRQKIVKAVAQIISVTLGAQIVVFPIMIYVFNTFSLNFIVSNLLISELVGPILVLGYISLLFPFFSVLEKILINIVLILAKFLAHLPLNNLLLTTPSLFCIIQYYCFLGVIVYAWKFKKLYLVRKVKKNKLKSIVIVFIVLVILFGNFQMPFRNNLEIHFLDVGQGDSCLIRTPHNKTILVDGGNGEESGYDYGEKVVIPYLLDHGITKLDYIIVSHFDSDHVRPEY